MNLHKALEWISENEQRMREISKEIWRAAETAFREEKSSSALIRELKKEGFEVEEAYGGIPTAFRAVYGSGSPVIGLLAEYDALPGLSQKVSSQKEPVEENAAGHGCGHNLMAVSCLTGALALKEAMEREDECSVVLYGCPAEEILVGKGFMAREGAFQELDVAVSWHPGSQNAVSGSSSSALVSGEFFFKGVTAHAAQDPYNGRSALDAVELMDVAANYLREHVSRDARIHYQITNGGEAPNIVPEKASVLYFTRANNRKDALEVFERVKKCADGASLMTETSYTLVSRGGCYETLLNESLNEVMEQAMRSAQRPEYTPEELDFADQLNRLAPSYEKAMESGTYQSIFTEIYGIGRKSMGGSTDVGDVSHIAPFVMFTTASHNSLASGHSWQVTASSGHAIGEKGMLFASRIMVQFVDLILKDPSILERAKKEFLERTRGEKYISPVSDEMRVEDFYRE